MKTNVLVLISLFLFAGVVSGQDAFKVLMNKGTNEVKTGTGWQPIKVGASLKASDEIKLPENAYLGLIHVSGKPLELKEAGKYSVADLDKKIGSSGTSVLNKYADFVLSANKEKKNNLAATGAVHRGPNNIKIYLPKPESAIVYNNTVIISWEKDKAQSPYLVTFKSMFGDELKKAEVTENAISIDLNDSNFDNEDNIIVTVASKADRNKVSDEYTLKKLSKGDKVRIKNSLNEIVEQTAEQTALNKLVLAGFYEQNGLLIDASTAYLEAIKLAPDVTPYADAYNDFLLRNALKEQPVKK
ncbi:MAG: hypothetical protein JNM57_16975 [Cyclobacteriaceae bacterium]|nr:hypothetical protein [Cyclobacteriaceae bacterium]